MIAMSTNGWSEIALGTVLHRRREELQIDETESYKRVTIRLNSQGVILRNEAIGAEIGTKRQFRIRSGQFILSKIDARNGAFGVVPAECDNAIITGNFWTFDVDPDKLDARYFYYLTRTPLFIDFCIRASEGTTNRRYLQENRFLAQQLRLPPLLEQRRLVAKIDRIAAKINEANSLHAAAFRESAIVSASQTHATCFGGECEVVAFGNIIDTIKNGLYRPPEYWGYGVPCVRMYNINGPTLNTTDIQCVNVTEEEFAEYGCNPGDLILNRINSAELVGKAAMVPLGYPACVFEAMNMRIRLKNDVDPQYAAIVLNASSTKDYVRRVLKQQCGQASLNQQHVRRIPFPNRPMFEQRRIVAYLDGLQAKVDELKRLAADSAAELDALLPAILDRAFKGEL